MSIPYIPIWEVGFQILGLLQSVASCSYWLKKKKKKEKKKIFYLVLSVKDYSKFGIFIKEKDESG